MRVAIGHAAIMIGVSISTLRRWEKSGKFTPNGRTLGGHRRYDLESLQKIVSPSHALEDTSRIAVAYSRVSSSDQISDLKTQSQKLSDYCAQNFSHHVVISDLGSGLNFKKPGLKKLLRMMFLGQISHLILNHKDRLLRFGNELIFQYGEHFGVQVIILEDSLQHNFEEELVADVIQLMTVFSAKLYGKRSHQNKKKMAA